MKVTRLTSGACRAAVFATLVLGVLTPAMASNFTVTPVRIYMGPRDRAVAVTISNDGDTPVALQADLNLWTQSADGADELTLTDDLILSPPLIKLAPGAKQVVRLALVKPADLSRQLTYRLIMREIPQATAPKDTGIQVPIALALSMPVFITPPKAEREVSCTLMRKDADVSASCMNKGNAYAQIREILVKRGDKTLSRFEGGAYLLPGSTKTLPLKSVEAVATGMAQLIIGFDDAKTQSFDVALP